MDAARAEREVPLTILIVDDAPDMRFLARVVLQEAGIEVVGEAANGREALELFRALKPPPVPTVILLDNMMPGLTGIEAARRILDQTPDQLIVLFSAFLDEEVEAEARALGVTACVPKMRVNELPVIMRVIAEGSAAGSPAG